MRPSPRRVPPLLLALPCLAWASPAHAELPQPGSFDVAYWVTDRAGTPRRPMEEDDFTRFINRARCECGHTIAVKIRAQVAPEDDIKRFEAFVGPMCAAAEVSFELRRCGRLASEVGVRYETGIERTFHPAFLRHGVDPSTPTRAIDDPAAVLAGACEGSGVSGLWACKPGENSIALCQQDEFFLAPGAASALAGIESLGYDFDPPPPLAGDLSVEPGNGAVRLTWSLSDLGDIAGLRVLCEEAESGAAPGLSLATPGLTDKPDGTHYFTARNLCEGAPFSTVEVADALPPADPDTCGNGMLEPGEDCDDGPDNHPDGLCAPDCRLRVGTGLHALAWDHLCSGHLAPDADSVVIGGLDNGTAYNFVLVAHDAAGNPRALARVVAATPDASLPDLLPAAGCGCATGFRGHVPFTMSLGTLALLRRRRRR